MKSIISSVALLAMVIQLSAQSIQIGTGTATTSNTDPSPVNISQAGLNSQVIYTNNEMSQGTYAAAAVAFSSERSTLNALQISGNPNVYPTHADHANSWSSATPDGQREFIVAAFGAFDTFNVINIFETFNPGAIDTVYIDQQGTWTPVYTATASTAAAKARILTINFPKPTHPYSLIRIALNSPAVTGYNSIDAIQARKTDSLTITQFGLYIASSPAQPLTNFTIKMMHTQEDYVDAHISSSGAQTVYSNASYAPTSGGFDTLTLTSPFLWNGYDNLLVEICFGPVGTTSNSGTIRYYSFANGYRSVSGSGSQCGNATTSVSNKKPQALLTFSGNASTGDIGVMTLLNPDIFDKCNIYPQDTITIVIRNYGTTAQTGFNVSYKIDTNATVTENVGSLVVQPGIQNIMPYEFATKANLSAAGNYNFKAWTSLAGDNSALNDTIATIIQKIDSFPHTKSNDTSICAGNTVTLSMSGAIFYAWSTGDTLASIQVSPTSTTTYTCQLSDGVCSTIDSITVTVGSGLPKPTITASGSTSVCAGDSVMLTSSSAQFYQWNTGATAQSIYATQTGNYYVIVSDSNGCSNQSDTTSVVVELSAHLVVSSIYTTICIGDTVHLEVVNGQTYNWSTGATTQSIESIPAVSTTYSVSGTTPLGCSYADTVDITVIPALPPDTPSAYTPVQGLLNQSMPFNISWAPANNASNYDVFIWEKDSLKPAQPFISNLNAFNTTIQSGLSYGKIYSWQVVAKNSCFETPGPVQFFSLTDLPDLTISSIQTPASLFSGQDITVSWTVKNIGGGSTGTGQWRDAVYLSSDTILDIGADYLLGNKANQSYLVGGQSYVETATYTIPNNLFGSFRVIVHTDYVGSILEPNDNNNIKADTATNYMTISLPPQPDLAMQSVGAPTAVFSGNDITVNYTVKNIGQGNAAGNDTKDYPYCNANERYWKDAVWISNSAVFHPDSSMKIQEFFIGFRSEQAFPPVDCGQISSWLSIPDFVAPDSSYTRQIQVTIPHSIFGTWYLAVSADGTNMVDPELSIANNTGLAPNPIAVTLTPPADLVVSGVNVPATGSSGNPLQVSWSVVNQGANAPKENTWYDHVYISLIDTFDSQAIHIGSKAKQNGSNLAPFSNYNATLSPSLPNGISGLYYVYVFTDADSNVFEYTFDNNNITRSTGTVNVSLSPSTDLIVSNMNMPDTITGMSNIMVSWTVQNQGGNTAKQPWYDRLFISTDSVYSQSMATPLSLYQHTQSLTSLQSKLINKAVDIPNFADGEVWFFAYTDFLSQVYEHGALDSNNISRSGPYVYIGGKPDLEITSFTAPASSPSGSNISCSWTTSNLGNTWPGTESWIDGIVISTDTLIGNADDLPLFSYNVKDSLSPGDSYNASAQVTIPNGLSGNYYILVYTDFNKAVPYDSNRANNLAYSPINITATPSPDLMVDNLSTPLSMRAGEPITVYYTVKNQGQAQAGATWSDKLLIMSSPTGANEIVLATKKYQSSLPVSSTYTDSFSIFLPPYLNGTYYMAVRTDVKNEVYETNETNNEKLQLVSIATPPPADLVVSHLAFPTSVMLGEEITMNMHIKNQGTNEAVGNSRQALHFSDDQVFEATADPLFGIQASGINLQPGDSTQISLKAKFPALPEGYYHGVGRTNIQNVIVESDLSNNTNVSSDTIAVSVKELIVNIPDTAVLDLNDKLYYKINTGAGFDMLLTLTSLGLQGANEVYIAFGYVPTENNYDFSFENPNSLDQMLMVPNTQAGTYYVYAKTTNKHLPDQKVISLAKLLPFSVMAIQEDTVGNSKVTTTITGAGFRDSTIFSLTDNQGIAYATGEVVRLHHSMRADVLWYLKNVPLGTYNVKATNPNETTQLTNGLTIVEASGYLIAYNEITPPAIRAEASETYSFFFENAGNIDIPFILGEFAVPAFVNVDEVSVTPNVRKRTLFADNSGIDDDYLENGNFKYIPYVVVGLKPGEAYNLNIRYSGFQGNVFPQRVRIQGFGMGEFITYVFANFMQVRHRMINNPNAYANYPDKLALASDSTAFMDSLFNTMIREGYFTRQNLLTVDPHCSGNCDSVLSAYGGIWGDTIATYSPGTSPGTGVFPSLEFNGGQDYLWEINKWGGTAGADPGWDLLRSTGALTINASVANPFIIRVASLAYGNYPSNLAGWWPSQAKYWPIAIAGGGINNFNPGAFYVNTSQFEQYNNLYGGFFYVNRSGDTLLLCFQPHIPGPGENGVPGAPGAPGECGSPGGKGGPGGPSTTPGKGGRGGDGGPGYGTTPAGCGGNGGDGGDGVMPGQQGGEGGDGGTGGQGGAGMGGGQGGDGGQGGTGGPNGPGGNGGNGGQGGDGSFAGPGGAFGIGGLPGPGSSTSGNSGAGGSNGSPNNPNTDPPGPDNCPVCDLPQEDQECDEPGITYQQICNLFFTGVGCAEAVFACAGGAALPVIGWIGCGLGVAGCAADIYSLVSGDPDGDHGVGDVVSPPIDFKAKGLQFDPLSFIKDMTQKVICDNVLKSCDPNDITGPAGYDSLRWMAKDKAWPYMIRFENDASLASTAAQRVEVTQALDPHLNPLSFRVAEFGFGGKVFTPPTSTASYFTTLDLPDSLGYDVEFTAGVDVVNNQLIWVFQTIDPHTGLPPVNPFVGFLGINDSFGSGEGYVKYTIWPKSNTQTGDTVLAKADIVFDINPVIETNTWRNVIDAVAPGSDVNTLPAYTQTTTFTVQWSGTDDPGGTGVRAYELFMSIDGQAFTSLGSTTSVDTTITGNVGSRYAFYTIATDQVGNRESNKSGDEFTIIGNPGFFLQPYPGSTFCQDDSIEVVWSPAQSSATNINLLWSPDSMQTWVVAVTNWNATDSTYQLVLPVSITAEAGFIIKAVNQATGIDIDTGSYFTVLPLPTVDAGLDATLCGIDSVMIGGTPVATGTTGPYHFIWEPAAGLSDPLLPNPFATASNNYMVTATDQRGCTQSDTTVISINPIPATPAISAQDSLLTSSASSGNQWYLNGQAISGATGQTHIAIQTGNYTVISTVNGCNSDTSAAYFYVVTGISAQPTAIGVSVYPNPASDVLQIHFQTKRSGDINIEMLNMAGQMVLQETMHIDGESKRTIDLNGWPKGYYKIVVRGMDINFKKEVIVQ